jgi:hypothetical protein
VAKRSMTAEDVTPAPHVVRGRGGKVPVTMRALIARINRKLTGDDMQLKKTKGVRARIDLGDYYVLNTRYNAIMYHYKDCDPEELGRELGVIKPYERLDEEEA